MNILVTGAKGVVGVPLCKALLSKGDKPLPVSRTASKGIIQWDLQKGEAPQFSKKHTLFHCAPIWLLPKHIEFLSKKKVKRIVAFSSTSAFSKQVSGNSYEQKLASLLIDAEIKLFKLCKKHNINITIFRPTLIYGYGRDQNISRIAKFVRCFRFAILAGQASGLRQPVHADDLVKAVLKAQDNPKTFGKAYNLSGKETMTYREMVERIFTALNIRPRIVSCPVWLLRMLLSIAARLSSFGYTPDMADRMNQDLCFDSSKAKNDFSYKPQSFLRKPKRDLLSGVGIK